MRPSNSLLVLHCAGSASACRGSTTVAKSMVAMPVSVRRLFCPRREETGSLADYPLMGICSNAPPPAVELGVCCVWVSAGLAADG